MVLLNKLNQTVYPLLQLRPTVISSIAVFMHVSSCNDLIYYN